MRLCVLGRVCLCRSVSLGACRVREGVAMWGVYVFIWDCLCALCILS